MLILDANVVIHLHEFGIWDKLIAACDVHLPGTGVTESDFFEVDDERHYIDLNDDISHERIQVFNVELSRIKAFRDQFDSLYVGGLDDGETEALAFLERAAPDERRLATAVFVWPTACGTGFQRVRYRRAVPAAHMALSRFALPLRASTIAAVPFDLTAWRTLDVVSDGC